MNIAEILKNCPKGTKLYSSIFGEVELLRVDKHSITCMIDFGVEESFQSDGKYMARYPDAECVLFPSKDQRDWSKFRATDKETKPQFKPFDKVLVRDRDDRKWGCDFFCHLGDKEGVFVCISSWWRQCIPYEGNEHLLGTTNKQQ
jgi:hypothetical protein